MWFLILDIENIIFNYVLLLILLNILGSCLIFLFLSNLLKVSIVCRGFVLSVWALYSLLRALYSLSGLCKVCLGFVKSFGASPPRWGGGIYS